MLVLVAAVSLTVIVAQQQQQLKQRAETPNYCADPEIKECITDIVKKMKEGKEGNDCVNGNPDFKCKIFNADRTEFEVWGCVTPTPTQ